MDAALDRFFTPLKALPFPACGSSSWSTAIDALRKGLTASTNGWRESSNTCGLQLYVEQIPASGVPMNAAIYVVFDKGLKLSDIPNLKGNKWKSIADAELNRPVFSIASVERTMTTADGKMPASLRSLFAPGSRYGGLQQFTVPVGPQLFTHASLKGTVGKFLKDALNAPIDNLWIRSGFASESASDLLNREGSKFLEILMPPGTTLSGPLGITEARVSDATIQIDDAKNVSLMGNMSFESAAKGKVFPAVLDLPATPAGTVDWSKAQMALSTPSVITMEEFAKVSLALNTQVASGGLLTEIAPAKTVLDKIALMFKPLSTFKLTNPNPNADSFRLKAGNDYPEMSKFNFVVLSAKAKAKDGSNKDGPILRLKAGVKVLGKQLANTNTDLSKSGLHTETTGSFGMDLKSVGNYNLSAKASIHIDEAKQDASVSGGFNTPVIGRSAVFAFNPNEIAFTSPATCVVPIEFGTKIPLSGDPSIESIASGLNPVKVDVGKLVGCTKEQLEAAAKWVGNATVDAGKAIGEGAVAAYETVASVGEIFKAGTWKHEPARDVLDCTNFDSRASAEAAKFVRAYPPGRLWGSRDDYEKRGSNFARYVYSESERKFRPLANASVLGATGCGGLVGEKGEGYGRLNTDDKKLFSLALMCEKGKFPAHMVGTPVNNASECYAARRMSRARPDLAGKLVQAHGDDSVTTSIVTPQGTARFVGKKDQWSLFGECALGTRYPIVKVSLYEGYQMQQGAPIANVAECAPAMGALWVSHPRTGQIIYADCTTDKNTEMISADGKRHWISNKNNWVVYNACGLSDKDMTCVGNADRDGIPAGKKVENADECRALRVIRDARNGMTYGLHHGTKHHIVNAQVADECKLNLGNAPNVSANVIDGFKTGDAWDSGAKCRAAMNVAAPLPPVLAKPVESVTKALAQLSTAQRFKGKFIANCDRFKHTHLVGTDGKRYWIANKDTWTLWGACRRPTDEVQCITLNEVNSVPDGGTISSKDLPKDTARCLALRGD